MEALQIDTEADSDDYIDNSGIEEQGAILAISQQALWGTKSAKSVRVRGWVQGMELLMLIDSGSTHSFVDEQVGLKLHGVCELQQKLSVKIANGGLMQCSLELPNCQWWMQGHRFCNNFRILPLGNYDAILGMDWLEMHSPMKIDWVNKCMEFCYQGSLMYLVQLNQIHIQEDVTIPLAVKPVLLEFQELFEEPTELPPKRAYDHCINLIPGSKPINLRPYRHNPALKDEIERQIAEMLKTGVIQPSQSPFSSPAILVKKKDGTWRLVIDYR